MRKLRGIRSADGHHLGCAALVFRQGPGTWFRRLGSYSIQIVEPDTTEPLYEPADLIVTGHAPRHLFVSVVRPESALELTIGACRCDSRPAHVGVLVP